MPSRYRRQSCCVSLSADIHNLYELLFLRTSHTCHISSYQYWDPLFLKFWNDFIPLTLVHVTMKQPQIMILLLKVIGQLFCVCLLGDKKEDAPRRCELHEASSQPVPFARARGENLHDLSNIFICLRGEIRHAITQDKNDSMASKHRWQNKTRNLN